MSFVYERPRRTHLGCKINFISPHFRKLFEIHREMRMDPDADTEEATLD